MAKVPARKFDKFQATGPGHDITELEGAHADEKAARIETGHNHGTVSADSGSLKEIGSGKAEPVV